MKQYAREFAELAPAEQEATMEMMTSWERRGRQEGKEELVARQIRRRFGEVSPERMTQLDQLSLEQLNQLGEALLDFTSAKDLENWLSQNNPR